MSSIDNVCLREIQQEDKDKDFNFLLLSLYASFYTIRKQQNSCQKDVWVNWPTQEEWAKSTLKCHSPRNVNKKIKK